MKEPLLRSMKITYHGKPRTLLVYGGLQHIKGNSAPYFTLTGEVWRKGARDCEACGGMYDLILPHFPELADLAALRLSDIAGVPLYAAENGWYWLAGALPGNAGEEYHGGDSKRNYLKPDGAPRRGEWDTTDYREPTEAEVLGIFARHMRITPEEARGVRDAVTRKWEETRALCEDSTSDIDTEWTRKSWKGARAFFGEWVRQQRSRWQKEAEDCIARHGLVVFGDVWEGAKV